MQHDLLGALTFGDDAMTPATSPAWMPANTPSAPVQTHPGRNLAFGVIGATGLVSLLGTVAGAWYGYKQEQSIPKAVGYGLLGSLTGAVPYVAGTALLMRQATEQS